MSPLELRKQLLIAESELNRAELIGDWQVMAIDAHALANRVRSIGTFASAATALVVGVASLRRTNSADSRVKPSWLQTLLKGAGLISSVWLASRSPRRDHPDK